MISGSTRGCSLPGPGRWFMAASRWCPFRMQCRDGGRPPQRESSKERCNMTDALREKLVQAGRVLVSEDHGDYVAGHVTLRLPDGDGRFLMKPAGIGLEEMTPDNIITVDREGERVGGTMPRHSEVFIHSEILRARSDIVAVVHTHPPHAVAFSSLGRPLLPVGNDGAISKRAAGRSRAASVIIRHSFCATTASSPPAAASRRRCGSRSSLSGPAACS